MKDIGTCNMREALKFRVFGFYTMYKEYEAISDLIREI